MKIFKITFIVILASTLLIGCFKDQDDTAISNREINDFVWKGMNAVYLYKDEILDLADNRFSSNGDYESYLDGFSRPEELFESLIYQRQTVDRFSVITSDYIQLEQLLNGVFVSNGLEFNFYLVPGSNTEVFGIVRLVLHNSVADNLGIQRGQVFKGINGTNLVNDNALLNSLLNQNSYSLNLAEYNDNGTSQLDDDTIVPTNETVDLNKVPYTENPVYINEVLQVNGENVGYLMYNAFNSSFATELNEAFGTLKANNVQDLVLDLRYNGGGSVQIASFLGSMITGQYNGEVFSKLIYNSDNQAGNTNYNFTSSLGNGGASINSLNLNRLYVLTSSRTASASEMIINSLKEYITVIQIGDTTTGKSQASTIIYDSPTLRRENINPNHTYAMLPLIAISVNKNDGQVPPSGLVPETTFKLLESPRNFGVLGDPSEPLLARAIQHISGNGRFSEGTLDDFVAVKPVDDHQTVKNMMFVNPLDH